ncbi:MAG: pilin [Candidatus Paceibacterota bacterium]|jgi:hypothetical protein
MNNTLRTLSATSGLTLAAGVFLLPASTALAATTAGLDDAGLYVPLTTIPGLITAGVATNPVTIIMGVYGLAIGIGSVIATVMIIWAGFEYMYVEAIGKKSAAKERITNAFLGLLVILGSYILLRTINPNLVSFNVTLPGGAGSKGLAGLIAIEQNYEAQQQRLLIAQRDLATLKLDVTALDALIASSTDPDTIAQLKLVKATKEASISTTRATALADNAVTYVEKYLSAPTTSYTNTDTYFENARTGFDDARTKLEDLYAINKDPSVAKQIEDIDTRKLVFNGNASQLQAVKNWQNAEGLIDPDDALSTKETVANIKKTGDDMIYYLRQTTGNDKAISTVQASTIRRVHMICPTCN